MRFSDISSRCRAFPGFRQDLRQGEEKAQSLKLGSELGFWLRKQDLNPRPSGYTLSLIICTCNTIYKYYNSRLQGLLTSSCITMYHHVYALFTFILTTILTFFGHPRAQAFAGRTERTPSTFPASPSTLSIFTRENRPAGGYRQTAIGLKLCLSWHLVL